MSWEYYFLAFSFLTEEYLFPVVPSSGAFREPGWLYLSSQWFLYWGSHCGKWYYQDVWNCQHYVRLCRQSECRIWVIVDHIRGFLKEVFCLPKTDHQSEYLSSTRELIKYYLKVILIMSHEGTIICKEDISCKPLKCFCFCCEMPQIKYSVSTQ